METIFLKIVNMSLTASWLVLAVLAVRLIFRKTPKWILCLLWGLVAIRLVCPLSVESALSLIPNPEPLPQEILFTPRPEVHSGVDAVDAVVNPVLEGSLTPSPGASANPTQIWSFLFSWIWAIGVAAMLLYALVSFLLLKRRVAAAIPLEKNVKQSEFIASPFVLGIFRPVIYLPFAVREGDMPYVIAHERAHIRRRDHWWKPLGFLLLSMHWFNPLMWAAYILLCRDIEAACDEKVIRSMRKDELRAYSTALLHCSVHRRRIAACPLAFGEVGVKDRVKRVMNYKKPAFWVVCIAIVLAATLAICFLTDPPGGKTVGEENRRALTLDDVVTLSQKGNDLTWEDFDPYLYTETGSGLYIRIYGISEQFSLAVGGGKPEGIPMYVRLENSRTKESIDIREERVSDFLKAQTQGPGSSGEVTFYTGASSEDKYYLTIAQDGVASIEVSSGNQSGGCSHGDNTPFALGEKVYLEQLDGLKDLSGVTVTAVGSSGETLFSLSVPASPNSQPITAASAGGWVLAPEGYDFSSAYDPDSETEARQVTFGLWSMTMPDGYDFQDVDFAILLLRDGTTIGGITFHQKPDFPLEMPGNLGQWIRAMGLLDAKGSGQPIGYMAGSTLYGDFEAEIFNELDPERLNEEHHFFIGGDTVFDVYYNQNLVTDAEAQAFLKTIRKSGEPAQTEPTDNPAEASSLEQCRAVLNLVQSGSHALRCERKNGSDDGHIRYWQDGGDWLTFQTHSDGSKVGFLYKDGAYYDNGEMVDGKIGALDENGAPIWKEGTAHSFHIPWLARFRWNADAVAYIDTLQQEEETCVMLRIDEAFPGYEHGQPYYFVNMLFDSAGNFLRAELTVNPFQEDAFSETESVVTLEPEAVAAEIDKEYQRAIG